MSQSEEEIVWAVKSRRQWKASGSDGCVAEYYKAVLDSEYLKKLFVNIIQKFWKSGSYPESVEQLEVDEPAADELVTPTIKLAKKYNLHISYQDHNPKSGDSYVRYEQYKRSETVADALKHGARQKDLNHDFKHGFLTIHDYRHREPRDEPGDLSDDSDGIMFEQ